MFWRNALYAWNTASSLREALLAPKFQAALRASADAATKSDDQSFDDFKSHFDALTNQTSVLVAASVMVK